MIDVLIEESNTSVGEYGVSSRIVAASGSPGIGYALALVVVVDSVLDWQDRMRVHVRLEEGAVGRVGFPEGRFDHQQGGGVRIQDILHPGRTILAERCFVVGPIGPVRVDLGVFVVAMYLSLIHI